MGSIWRRLARSASCVQNGKTFHSPSIGWTRHRIFKGEVHSNIQYLGRYSLFETYFLRFLRKISRLRSFTSYGSQKGAWILDMLRWCQRLVRRGFGRGVRNNLTTIHQPISKGPNLYWALIPSKNQDYGHKSKVYRYILYRILIILQNTTVTIIMSYYYKCLFIKKLPNLYKKTILIEIPEITIIIIIEIPVPTT